MFTRLNLYVCISKLFYYSIIQITVILLFKKQVVYQSLKKYVNKNSLQSYSLLSSIRLQSIVYITTLLSDTPKLFKMILSVFLKLVGCIKVYSKVMSIQFLNFQTYCFIGVNNNCFFSLVNQLLIFKETLSHFTVTFRNFF